MSKEAGKPNAAAPRVFICYRREETAAHAGRLYDAMVARFGEDNVFMDVELAPGVDFVERITEVVSACQVLIVVMGPNWAKVEDEQGDVRVADPDDFVRLEVETALRRADVTPIPVLVAGAQMPKQEDLPRELWAITRRNALELSEARWRYDVGRLNDTLDELLADFSTTAAADSPTAPSEELETPVEATPPPATPPRAGWPPLKWVIPGAIALLAIAALVLVASGGSGKSCSLDQVACVIETVSKPTGSQVCNELETKSYLEQTTFSVGQEAVSKCRTNALNMANDPDSVDVSNIQMSGGTATAEASFSGGFYAGQTQVLALVKNGDRWMLDRIKGFKDFDVARYIAAYEKTVRYANPPLMPAEAKCVAGQLAQLVTPDELETAILAGDNAPFARAYEVCEVQV